MKPSTTNRTELGAQERCDALILRYGLDPPDLSKYCDSCNANFTIYHALDCKRGGLVTAFLNEIWDRVAELAGKAFAPSQMCDDPLIFADFATNRPKAKQAGPSGSTDQDVAPPSEAT